jgi:hypothetical protein
MVYGLLAVTRRAGRKETAQKDVVGYAVSVSLSTDVPFLRNEILDTPVDSVVELLLRVVEFVSDVLWFVELSVAQKAVAVPEG